MKTWFKNGFDARMATSNGVLGCVIVRFPLRVTVPLVDSTVLACMDGGGGATLLQYLLFISFMALLRSWRCWRGGRGGLAAEGKGNEVMQWCGHCR
jgi:hypothetical protein